MQVLTLKLRNFLAPEAAFILVMYGLLLAGYSLLRLWLLLQCPEPASQIPPGVLGKSFLVGMRFDLVVCSGLLLPLFLGLLMFRGRGRSWVVGVFAGVSALFLLICLVEPQFFQEFGFRFNRQAAGFLCTPLALVQRLGSRHRLWPTLAVGVLLVGGQGLLVRWQYRKLQSGFCENAPSAALPRTMGSVVLLALMLVALRGGHGRGPLQCENAYFSTSPFANQLALNGIFSWGVSLREAFDDSVAPSADRSARPPRQ